MPDHTRTKLPLQTLMDRAGCTTANELGAIIGLNRSAVQRLKSQGVPIVRADTLAMMCGFHPIEVWGAAYEQPTFADGRWEGGPLPDGTVAA